MWFDDVVIRAAGLGKVYHLFDRPLDRLRQVFAGRRHQYGREFWALREVSLELRRGEVLGIVGKNGAGKSTLLQLSSGTLAPSEGSIAVNGRVAALLELGAGFNPEYTGRQNVIMNAAIQGLSRQEIDQRFDDIVAFSGIGDFIDQPVKTYSSGMLVRLAFSVATCMAPDILVIDEALSVGDGEFARRSFDRIMALKEAGKTILFCSHSMYHIEALCSRAIWLRDGRVELDDTPASVVVGYNRFLDTQQVRAEPQPLADKPPPAATPRARLVATRLEADGQPGRQLAVASKHSDVGVDVEFIIDPGTPPPSVAVLLTGHDGRVVASSSTHNDGIVIPCAPSGHGRAAIRFERIPLLKGSYEVHVMLMCERGMHLYDYAGPIGRLDVSQAGLELGVVALPHVWTLGGH